MKKSNLLKQIVRDGNRGTISIVVKVTKRCNIRPACRYCYDYDARCDSKAFDMSAATLENLIRKSVGSGDFKRIIFVWHGGEPLVMGQKFYESAVAWQQAFNRDGAMLVENRIQTNAVSLDERWVHFLKKRGFQMETSFDAFDNERMRGKSAQVLANILRAKDVGYPPANIMCIVTSRNVHRLREVYDYFAERGLDFTPSPILALGEACRQNDLSITAEEYGRAVADLMDYMLQQPESRIRVRFVDAILKAVLFGEQNLCSHGYCVYEYVTADHNGDIYPCAKVDDPEWCFGNINQVSNLSDIFQGETYRRYARRAEGRLKDCARENGGEPCEVFRYCRGGCASNAKAAGGYTKRDFYCSAYRILFNHALEVRRGLEEAGLLHPGDEAPLQPWGCAPAAHAA